MIPWKRPPKPPRFDQDATNALDRLRARVEENGGIPRSDHFDRLELWQQHWRKDRGYKATLSGHTQGRIEKCAWCERRRDLSELDIDHFRPKTRLSEFEEEFQPRDQYRSDPPPIRPVGVGYWWFAFDWENWTLACTACNSTWKRTLFPIESNTRLLPEQRMEEIAAIIHPYEPFEPNEHFEWEASTGYMHGISSRGRMTIAVMGLNRTTLVAERRTHASSVRNVFNMLGQFENPPQEGGKRNAREAIRTFGERTQNFTGMVRWMMEHELRIKWGSVSWLPDDDSPHDEDETG